MSYTFAQKVLASKSGQSHVEPGDCVFVSPDLLVSHENTAPIADIFYESLELRHVAHPEKMAVCLDHYVPATTPYYAGIHRQIRQFARDQGIQHFFDVNAGIQHHVLAEHGLVRPGMLILAGDSHATGAGGLGAFSLGLEREELASLWATDKAWLRTPETIRVVVTGAFGTGVGAKDLALRLLGDLGPDGALYCALEFAGPAMESIGIPDRLVLCIMAYEAGAKIAYVEPDERTREWLADRTSIPYEEIFSDPNASYLTTCRYCLPDLPPQVAIPHTPTSARSVTEVIGTRIDQALLGTCANGSISDMRLAASILRGWSIAPGVRFLVVPASASVFIQAAREGLLEALSEAGAIILNPGCGPCLGTTPGGLADGEVCISTANRNYQGRLGSRHAEIYLANPATVTASAMAGKIVDPREYLP